MLSVTGPLPRCPGKLTCHLGTHACQEKFTFASAWRTATVSRVGYRRLGQPQPVAAGHLGYRPSGSSTDTSPRRSTSLPAGPTTISRKGSPVGVSCQSRCPCPSGMPRFRKTVSRARQPRTSMRSQCRCWLPHGVREFSCTFLPPQADGKFYTTNRAPGIRGRPPPPCHPVP